MKVCPNCFTCETGKRKHCPDCGWTMQEVAITPEIKNELRKALVGVGCQNALNVLKGGN
jgi:hypothetical protein